MRPLLRHSAGYGQGTSDWSVMLRSLACVCALGAAFLLIALVTTEPPPGSRLVLWSVDAIAFAIVAVLVLGRRRLPSWTSDVCAALLTLIVGVVILSYADPAGPSAFFYLWLSVHSFYFLPWRRAALQLVLMIVDYTAVLLVLGTPFPLARWWATVTTAVVVSTMVALLKSRLDTLVADLADAARTDAVTGLANRRAFDEQLDIELARAERSGQDLALVIGDLDGFKAVNDRLGHLQGDAVLRRVALRLARGGRRTDMAMRLGGDEFALLLPDAGVLGARLVAERMRLAVATEFAVDPYPITISLGIACFPEHGADAASLFLAADTALLAAKKTGRDRCVVSGTFDSAPHRPTSGPYR